MLRIYKYPFDVQDTFNIEMPEDAKVLAVQAQNEVPCIWAMVDDEQPPDIYRFRLFGTGHPIDIPRANLNHYIGTFQLGGGRFVGHLFQV